MRLFPKNFDKSLISLAVLAAGLVFVSLFNSLPNVFADDGEIAEVSENHHIVIFDGDKKYSIKTDATTVGEVISRVGLTLETSDHIEPSIETVVNADNYFINIYRSRPALVIDGLARKLIMTSSFDEKTIAEEAGFTIYDGDKVIVSKNQQFLELGAASVYEIIRGEGSTLTIREEIPFEEETIIDYTLEPGTSIVTQLGEVGEYIHVYSVKIQNGIEISRELINETVTKEPVTRITAVGAEPVAMTPLTARMGRNRYTVTKDDGTMVERQETFYDLRMNGVMALAMGWEGCSHTGHYSVREDGVKVDDEGYILVAANLDYYDRCSVVQTSLGLGKVYDTGTFAVVNPEQFDIATDWTNENGE